VGATAAHPAGALRWEPLGRGAWEGRDRRARAGPAACGEPALGTDTWDMRWLWVAGEVPCWCWSQASRSRPCSFPRCSLSCAWLRTLTAADGAGLEEALALEGYRAEKQLQTSKLLYFFNFFFFFLATLDAPEKASEENKGY